MGDTPNEINVHPKNKLSSKPVIEKKPTGLTKQRFDDKNKGMSV
jgi:hypothetical protein